jgi:spore maturation protein SpmB
MKSDPVKAATLMATMTAFGAGTATTVDFLTAKVRDEESIPEQLYRYISSAGGFGVYADTLQSSIRSSEGIASAIGGPFIGDVGRKVYALKQGLVEGNWDLMQREMRKDIPIIGTTVNNLVEQ